ncbi:gephyrin-like molybdotransferase receptor GlpR [Mycobacterium sp.]|uniref:divisome protein SepX/GlpR n=1 Tax=Mycobacterium sp. TaxID=1785 RepID=UPI003A8A215B
MPSIPQSLLWISLVVLWLFVLVPMLVSKRDTVRRTSDLALATRVLNGGVATRLLRRTGPAAGHRSDPDWQPEEECDTDQIGGAFAEATAGHGGDLDDPDTDVLVWRRSVVTTLAKTGNGAATVIEPDYLDVDVVDEDADALPTGLGAVPPAARADDIDPGIEDAAAVTDSGDAADRMLGDDEFEYVDDSSGLEPEEEDGDEAYPAPRAYTSGASRQRRFDNGTAAAVSARKYAFRKRALVTMTLSLIASAIVAFEVTPLAWWVCGAATVITLFYLAYLRRQTRIEEKVRRRRAQRTARARAGIDNTEDREYDLVPSRLRRPGSVVLEIDDEDPIFEHLDYGVAARHHGWPRDLPRAVGQ